MSGIGAVVYAKDHRLVTAFYAAVLDMATVEVEDDFALLQSDDTELVVVRIPEEIAAEIDIAEPPVRRGEQTVKAVFGVSSIADARAVAPRFGGIVDPPEAERSFRDAVVCDGHDPEGNVFRLRQLEP